MFIFLIEKEQQKYLCSLFIHGIYEHIKAT